MEKKIAPHPVKLLWRFQRTEPAGTPGGRRGRPKAMKPVQQQPSLTKNNGSSNPQSPTTVIPASEAASIVPDSCSPEAEKVDFIPGRGNLSRNKAAQAVSSFASSKIQIGSHGAMEESTNQIAPSQAPVSTGQPAEGERLTGSRTECWSDSLNEGHPRSPPLSSTLAPSTCSYVALSSQAGPAPVSICRANLSSGAPPRPSQTSLSHGPPQPYAVLSTPCPKSSVHKSQAKNLLVLGHGSDLLPGVLNDLLPVAHTSPTRIGSDERDVTSVPRATNSRNSATQSQAIASPDKETTVSHQHINLSLIHI